VSSADETREWLDEQIRDLVKLYLAGKMERDSDELRMRTDGAIIAAGIRRRHPERRGVGL
jgi:hypothetical protein